MMKANALDKPCHLCRADNPWPVAPSFNTEDVGIVGGESLRSTFRALEVSHCTEVVPVGVEELVLESPVNSAVGFDDEGPFAVEDRLFRRILGPRLATGISKRHCVPDSRQFVHR